MGNSNSASPPIRSSISSSLCSRAPADCLHLTAETQRPLQSRGLCFVEGAEKNKKGLNSAFSAPLWCKNGWLKCALPTWVITRKSSSRFKSARVLGLRFQSQTRLQVICCKRSAKIWCNLRLPEPVSGLTCRFEEKLRWIVTRSNQSEIGHLSNPKIVRRADALTSRMCYTTVQWIRDRWRET